MTVRIPTRRHLFNRTFGLFFSKDQVDRIYDFFDDSQSDNIVQDLSVPVENQIIQLEISSCNSSKPEVSISDSFVETNNEESTKDEESSNDPLEVSTAQNLVLLENILPESKQLDSLFWDDWQSVDIDNCYSMCR